MSKEDKLTYLFDEIGGIDDSFVNEALIIKRKRSALKLLIRTASAAAVVVVITVIGVFAVASMANGTEGSEDAPITTTTGTNSQHINEQSPSDTPSQDGDSQVVVYLKDAIGNMDTESFEQVSFDGNNKDTLFDGNVRFIWTYDGSVYYSVTVQRPRDIVAIEDYLASDDHRVKTADPHDEDFKFWISYGDGRTTSPFLENNVGGTSFGELSDYVPEVYPSYEFAQFIAELIEDA